MDDYFDEEKKRYGSFNDIPEDKKIIENLGEVERGFCNAIAPVVKSDKFKAIACSSTFLGLAALSGVFSRLPLQEIFTKSPSFLLAMESGSLFLATAVTGVLSCFVTSSYLDSLAQIKTVKRGVASSRIDGFNYIRLVVPKEKENPSYQEIDAFSVGENEMMAGFFGDIKKQYKRKPLIKSVLGLGMLGLIAFSSAFVSGGKAVESMRENASAEQSAPAMIEK